MECREERDLHEKSWPAKQKRVPCCAGNAAHSYPSQDMALYAIFVDIVKTLFLDYQRLSRGGWNNE